MTPGKTPNGPVLSENDQPPNDGSLSDQRRQIDNITEAN